MKALLKSTVVRALEAADLCPTRLTDAGNVLALMRELRPKLPSCNFVRIGSNGDGGYLVPQDLDDIEACFSPGVSNVSDFERDCADRGMNVFLADASVDGAALSHPRFQFKKKFVGATSNSLFMTLDEWVAESVPANGSDLILQMDIEGGEYETLLAASGALLSRFRIIVTEFHNLQLLWSEPYFGLVASAFRKLLQTHTCVHIHPNNYFPVEKRSGVEISPIMEFTFLRNDRMGRSPRFASQFPHPLDADNTSKPHVALGECWYRL